MELTLPKWYDLHTHFRQGPNMGAYIADHLAMGCAGALAMPNTRPPVSQITGPLTDSAWSIEAYQNALIAAGADAFDQLIVPLYLTPDTTPEMIVAGAKSGMLRACKYYPPHGTTNAEHGIPMRHWIGGDVFRAMADHGIVLCVHGEQHGLSGPSYFDFNQSAESIFYTEILPDLLDAHPQLRLVCEHITTQEAVTFVETATDHVGATVTPQHLLYTVGHLIQGLKFHLYCLPVVKFERDRRALHAAVMGPGQSKFFAGTDSAPHTTKATECGCAAGCYTGGCAPQLYAMAFELAGADLATPGGVDALSRFLCRNGPAFYGFETSKNTFTLSRQASTPAPMHTEEGSIIPLPYGMGLILDWTVSKS